MANKIVALLLLVCLVVGNVEGESYQGEDCFNNCHRELDGKHTVFIVNGKCLLRCVKFIGKFHFLILYVQNLYLVLDHVFKFKNVYCARRSFYNGAKRRSFYNEAKRRLEEEWSTWISNKCSSLIKIRNELRKEK